ncbi:hypothetical protein DUNSADRAFT_8154 [Dunaliella salina]|uniref:Malic enzyme N-terminal domain-containing protein n=1 Tax=Dunaliella salina TaxID=3046 RepID=A0ABQ7GJY1_DUNSA|nr:hypothetical protein DUNSADRAFT_8154 [Dunaliella salina]|eukprot:KAF5834928.1 hypothetical protein DUNSADRAFT_8154 [Dunaliella salina]
MAPEAHTRGCPSSLLWSLANASPCPAARDDTERKFSKIENEKDYFGALKRGSSRIGCSASTCKQVAHNMEGQQEDLGLNRLNAIPSDIEKYMWLRALLETHSDEYYRLLTSQTERVLPFIYTPTVGEACSRYFELKQRPQEPRLRPNGLFLSLEDRGKILEKLRSWPRQNVCLLC